MCGATFAVCQPANMSETQTITELAREFGVTTRAIRYWESHGLVSPAREGGNRIYNKRDQTRLKLALRGKRLGLSLAEIRELIDMYDTAADESSQLLSFLGVLAQRRASLEQQRDDIQAVLKEIARFERQCREMLKSDAANVGSSPRAKKQLR
jgi:DNA-binding transcriptional MerR regulator